MTTFEQISNKQFQMQNNNLEKQKILIGTKLYF